MGEQVTENSNKGDDNMDIGSGTSTGNGNDVEEHDMASHLRDTTCEPEALEMQVVPPSLVLWYVKFS